MKIPAHIVIGFAFTQISVTNVEAHPPSDTCRMKLGMNLFNLSYTDVQQPFVDLMKSCDTWRSQDTAGISVSTFTSSIGSIAVDADGYPLQLPITVSGQPQAVVTRMVSGINGYYPAGNYLVLYDGTGTFRFAGSSVSVVSNIPGRIELRIVPDNTGIYVKIVTSSATNHVRNIRVLMPGTEFTYQSQTFNAAFIAKVAPFTTLRFMEWNNTNTNQETQWQNRRMPTYYTQGSSGNLNAFGIAHEYMIKLCNSTGKDCWVSVPVRADSNYIAKLAEMFRDSLNPQLKIYLEYGNEDWNTGFPTTYNYIDSAAGPPASFNHSQRTGYFMKRVFDTWKNIFSGPMTSRVVRVAPGWTNQPVIVQDIMAYPNANGSGADAISADAYFKYVQADYNQLNALCPNVTVANVFSIMNARLPSLYSLLVQMNTLAASYHLPLIFYEGGQQIQPNMVTCPQAQDVIRTAQTDTAMYNLYRTWFQKLRDTTSATLFNHFHLAGGGVFGALTSIYDNTSQKYQALIDYVRKCQQVSTGVEHSSTTSVTSYALQQNFPNPFNPTTTIRYSIPERIFVHLEIYNILGQHVATLVDEEQDPGNYRVQWDTGLLPGGLYFYQLRASQFVDTKKLLLLR
jgi:hypothetical protein